MSQVRSAGRRTSEECVGVSTGERMFILLYLSTLWEAVWQNVKPEQDSVHLLYVCWEGTIIIYWSAAKCYNCCPTFGGKSQAGGCKISLAILLAVSTSTLSIYSELPGLCWTRGCTLPLIRDASDSVFVLPSGVPHSLWLDKGRGFQ